MLNPFDIFGPEYHHVPQFLRQKVRNSSKLTTNCSPAINIIWFFINLFVDLCFYLFKYSFVYSFIYLFIHSSIYLVVYTTPNLKHLKHLKHLRRSCCLSTGPPTEPKSMASLAGLDMMVAMYDGNIQSPKIMYISIFYETQI